MTKSEDIQEIQNPTPEKVASVRRRMGFVALLWCVSAIAGTIGLLTGMPAGWGRYLLIGISWVFAIFFTFAWRQLRRGHPSQ